MVDQICPLQASGMTKRLWWMNKLLPVIIGFQITQLRGASQLQQLLLDLEQANPIVNRTAVEIVQPHQAQ
jgi:hypothetical protein